MNLGPSSTVVRVVDLPDYRRAAGSVAVIAAVPPYVPDAELDLMPAEGTGFEPLETHSGGCGGLDEVGLLVEESAGWLQPGGVLLVELHRDQAPHAIRLAETAGLGATTVSSRTLYKGDGHTAVLVARRTEGVNRDER